jgi:hypothetical protein
MENHEGKEKSEMFSGMRFQRKHTVRSLRSANDWKRFYAPTHLVRCEREGPAKYNVYIRRK